MQEVERYLGNLRLPAREGFKSVPTGFQQADVVAFLDAIRNTQLHNGLTFRCRTQEFRSVLVVVKIGSISNQQLIIRIPQLVTQIANFWPSTYPSPSSLLFN